MKITKLQKTAFLYNLFIFVFKMITNISYLKEFKQ